MPEDIHASRIQATQLHAQQIAQASLSEIVQEESDEKFGEFVDDVAYNPLAIANRFKPLEVKTRQGGRKNGTDRRRGTSPSPASRVNFRRVSQGKSRAAIPLAFTS